MILAEIRKIDLVVGFFTAGLIAFFFLPASQIFEPYVGSLSFPLVSLLFFLPFLKNPLKKPVHLKEAILISALPLVLSLGFGWAFHSPAQSLPHEQWLWVCVLIPIGEELLFRGWIYEGLDRKFPGQTLSLTNALPISIWGSSFVFGLWHLQNMIFFSPFFVLFQVAYTFWTGVWLSYLKYRTNSILVPIGFHCLLNMASLALC